MEDYFILIENFSTVFNLLSPQFIHCMPAYINLIIYGHINIFCKASYFKDFIWINNKSFLSVLSQFLNV